MSTLSFLRFRLPKHTQRCTNRSTSVREIPSIADEHHIIRVFVCFAPIMLLRCKTRPTLISSSLPTTKRGSHASTVVAERRPKKRSQTCSRSTPLGGMADCSQELDTFGFRVSRRSHGRPKWQKKISNLASIIMLPYPMMTGVMTGATPRYKVYRGGIHYIRAGPARKQTSQS